MMPRRKLRVVGAALWILANACLWFTAALTVGSIWRMYCADYGFSLPRNSAYLMVATVFASAGGLCAWWAVSSRRGRRIGLAVCIVLSIVGLGSSVEVGVYKLDHVSAWMVDWDLSKMIAMDPWLDAELREVPVSATATSESVLAGSIMLALPEELSLSNVPVGADLAKLELTDAKGRTTSVWVSAGPAVREPLKVFEDPEFKALPCADAGSVEAASEFKTVLEMFAAAMRARPQDMKGLFCLLGVGRRRMKLLLCLKYGCQISPGLLDAPELVAFLGEDVSYEQTLGAYLFDKEDAWRGYVVMRYPEGMSVAEAEALLTRMLSGSRFVE